MEEFTIELLDLAEENMENLLLEDENGDEKEGVGILAFRIVETGDEYIVYTEDALLEKEEVEITASKVVRTEEGLDLLDMSEEEWQMVQSVIDAMDEEES